jgi:hypothetical protein
LNWKPGVETSWREKKQIQPFRSWKAQWSTHAIIFGAQGTQVADGVLLATGITLAHVKAPGQEGIELLECSIVDGEGFCHVMPKRRAQWIRRRDSNQRPVRITGAVI